MTKNMGTVDRIIRTVLALIVVIFYFTGDLSGLAAIILRIPNWKISNQNK